MIEVDDMDGLVDDYVILLTGQMMSVGYSTGDNLVLLGPQGCIVSLDIDRGLMVE